MTDFPHCSNLLIQITYSSFILPCFLLNLGFFFDSRAKMKDFYVEQNVRNYGRLSQIYKIVSTQREIQDDRHQTM